MTGVFFTEFELLLYQTPPAIPPKTKRIQTMIIISDVMTILFKKDFF